jgi:hypothetical protein
MGLLQLFALFSLLYGASAGAQTLELAPYRAEYTVHADGFKVGEMTRSLQQEDGNWVLENTLHTTGLVALFKKDRLTERSVMGAAGQPLEYVYRYSGRNKEVVERLTFDWNDHQAASLRDGRTRYMAIKDGTFDKLAHQVALRRDLARGLTRMAYAVADRSKVETYEFEVVGKERLVTSVGTFDTVKVKKGTTMLWAAPELDYLVVQIVQKEDHTLSSYITALKR